jgi:hypothetical protein
LRTTGASVTVPATHAVTTAVVILPACSSKEGAPRRLLGGGRGGVEWR